MWPLILLPLVLAAPRTEKVLPSDVGSSTGYVEAAKHLINSMNFSVDPCMDFYDFACGGWMAKHPIPSDRTSYGTFTQVSEKVQKEMRELYESREEPSSNAIKMLRLIYKGCINEEEINRIGSKPLRDAIKAMNRWPLLHDHWEPKLFDLTALLIQGSARDSEVFFEMYAGQDIMNVTRRILQFDQASPGLGHGTRDYYLNREKFAKQINAYKEYMVAKALLLAEDEGLLVEEGKIATDVDEILAFETEFAKILVPEDERRNYSQLYHIRRVSDLDQLLPLIDWQRYLRSIMPYETHEYLHSDPEIVLTEPAFFTRLAELLNRTEQRIVANYIIMRYTSTYGLQLGTKYDDIAQDFARKMYGKKEKSPRWKDCVNVANSKLSYASGSMYVRAYFDSQSKNTTLAMVADLQDSFYTMLEENDWMDNDTKEKASSKAVAMLKQIGYPDFILSDEKLDHWYRDLSIAPTDAYHSLITKQHRWSNDFHYKRLLEKVDREEFSANPSVVNAYYSSIKNAIIFPAAILQIPFFHHSYPKALNYGGIGAVIGHEITHGFDDQGRQFDAVGNLKNWWNAKTTERFTERAKCIIKQYSDIHVPRADHNINGKLTQGENIADNGGVKEAYRAYKQYLNKHGAEHRIPGLEQYDNDQMFFIGYSQTWCINQTPETLVRQLITDPHSPGKYRVNVVLANQPEFAAAFKCPKNSQMNPVERCSVW